MRSLYGAIVILVAVSGAEAIEQCSAFVCLPFPGCSVQKEVTNCIGGVAQVRCVWENCSDPGDDYTTPWVSCYCNGGGGGCFLIGTPITMATGPAKPIQEVVEGDLVLSFDPVTNGTRPSKVTNVHEPRKVDHYFVVNEAIRMSGTQPVLSNGRWTEVAELAIGDVLTAKDGVASRVFSFRRVDEGGDGLQHRG